MTTTVAAHKEAMNDPWEDTCDACIRQKVADINDGGVYDHNGLRRMCRVHLNATIRGGNTKSYLDRKSGLTVKVS